VILHGKKLHYPTLIQALSTPPDIAQRDSEGKPTITTVRTETLPRILHLTLPAGCRQRGRPVIIGGYRAGAGGVSQDLPWRPVPGSPCR
jgi:hypothetical protein